MDHETIGENIARVRAAKLKEIEAATAKIVAMGIPHDLKLRLKLEWLKGDLAAREAELTRTEKLLLKVQKDPTWRP